MKIIIENDSKHGLWFRVVANNGTEIAQSTGYYANKRNLTEAIAKLKAGLPEAKVIDR